MASNYDTFMRFFLRFLLLSDAFTSSIIHAIIAKYDKILLLGDLR